LKFLDGVKSLSQDDLANQYLNNTWKPSVSVVGADGLPKASTAGNVLRQQTTLRLSIRIPPSTDGAKAYEIVKEKLTTDVPFNAKVTVDLKGFGNGWSLPNYNDDLKKCINNASNEFYGKDYNSYGIGGSIPFLCQLGKNYPETQIMAFGVLGSDSAAHNPNECINLTYVKKLIKCLSHILPSL
jgi:acetylornithine deacetylase/succinyl-diaminopimelate desuccinylase-like protein